MNRRWLILANPAAGRRARGRELDRIARVLGTLGIDADVERPEGAAAAAASAGEAARSGTFEAVVAYGGDGTVAAVAAGLAGSRMPLGVLPGGTANVLAREIGLPLDPVEAARRLASARPRAFDAARANGRLFLLMAGAGIDAAVMRDTPPAAKRLLGRGSIALTAIGAFLRGGFPRLAVELEGGERLEGAFAVASNIRLYGGPFAIAPEADPADGLLDLLVVESGRRRDLAAFAAALGRGARLEGGPGIHRRRVRSLRIEPVVAGLPVAIQLDGDYAFEAPVSIETVPQAIRLLYPWRGRR